MDEPLSNLDAQLRLEMRREIRAIQQRLGVTMVYVTHDQTEAMTMADQVILLRAGRVEQDAVPEVLYARPATAFTARFIGTPPMNVLACADRSVLLGVRPEDVRLAAADEPGAVAAVVQSVEYLGADSILTGAVGAQVLHGALHDPVQLGQDLVARRVAGPRSQHLPEQPRVAQRAAGEHDGGGPGALVSRADGLRAAQAAGEDDRGVEALHEARGELVVRRALVVHGRAARMEADRADAARRRIRGAPRRRRRPGPRARPPPRTGGTRRRRRARSRCRSGPPAGAAG
jgi:hypothetical protein